MDILLLLVLPVIACAVANAGVLTFVDILEIAFLGIRKTIEFAAVVHPNIRIISISTIIHYAIGVLARFVIIFYEIYDLPVSSQR